MKTSEVPPSTCPSCGVSTNNASGGSRAPEGGDISVCIYCGEFTIFNEDLTKRPLTEEEMKMLRESPQWETAELMSLMVRAGLVEAVPRDDDATDQSQETA